MRTVLAFKCEYCDEVGTHICHERLLNHFNLSLYELDENELIEIQDAVMTEDNMWWEDQLGEDFWELEEDE